MIRKKRKFYKVVFVLAFVLACLNPPMLFEQFAFATREHRLFLGSAVIVLLITKISKIRTYDLLVFAVVVSLSMLELLLEVTKLNNIISYYALILFYVLLFIVLRNREQGRNVFLKLWIDLGYLISVSAILLFFIHQFTSFHTDFLGFASLGDFSARELKFSFLGTTSTRSLGPVQVSRIYSYFNEPQFAALYFTINILLADVINQSGKYRKWFFCNLIAGLLTFSVTFYMAMVIILVLKAVERRSLFQSVIMSFIALLVVLPAFLFSEPMVFGFLGSSLKGLGSYDDREIRMLNAINILKQSSFFELLLGHGVGYRDNADRALASGLFIIIVERGIVGLLFVLTMMVTFLRGNLIRCSVCLLFSLALPWHASHIFWMGFLALWVATEPAENSSLEIESSNFLPNRT